MSFCKVIGFIKQIYENKSLSPNHFFTRNISRFTILICFLINFIKSSVYLANLWVYKSLSPNHVFTFKISRFTTFIFLLIILWFSIKIISLLKYLRNKFRQQYLVSLWFCLVWLRCAQDFRWACGQSEHMLLCRMAVCAAFGWGQRFAQLRGDFGSPWLRVHHFGVSRVNEHEAA